MNARCGASVWDTRCSCGGTASVRNLYLCLFTLPWHGCPFTAKFQKIYSFPRAGTGAFMILFTYTLVMYVCARLCKHDCGKKRRINMNTCSVGKQVSALLSFSVECIHTFNISIVNICLIYLCGDTIPDRWISGQQRTAVMTSHNSIRQWIKTKQLCIKI